MLLSDASMQSTHFEDTHWQAAYDAVSAYEAASARWNQLTQAPSTGWQEQTPHQYDRRFHGVIGTAPEAMEDAGSGWAVPLSVELAGWERHEHCDGAS